MYKNKIDETILDTYKINPLGVFQIVYYCISNFNTDRNIFVSLRTSDKKYGNLNFETRTLARFHNSKVKCSILHFLIINDFKFFTQCDITEYTDTYSMYKYDINGFYVLSIFSNNKELSNIKINIMFFFFL